MLAGGLWLQHCYECHSGSLSRREIQRSKNGVLNKWAV